MCVNHIVCWFNHDNPLLSLFSGWLRLSNHDDSYMMSGLNCKAAFSFLDQQLDPILTWYASKDYKPCQFDYK